MKVLYTYRQLIVFAMAILCLYPSCTSNLPEDLDALGDDVNYSQTLFEPTLGRNTEYQNPVVTGNSSTLPLTFKIVNPRTVTGQPATELTDKFAVKTWKSIYTGEEKSLEEIEKKRTTEYRPMLEIQEKSGNIFFWDSGNSGFVKTQPDSGYIFDVEISNSGGRRFARNLKLKPMKERPYEPSIYSQITGIATNSSTYPYRLENLEGERTGNFIFFTDVKVFFHKNLDNKNPGSSLTFSMLDSLNKVIDIKKFDKTDWNNLVHGFNPTFKNGKVTYDVAYPIPLVNLRTRYTDISGTSAVSNFVFDRKGRSGLVERNIVGLQYSIYEPGHWEIQVRFTGETPQFEDDK